MERETKTIEQIVSEFESRFADLYQDLVPVRSIERMKRASESAWQLAEWTAIFKEAARNLELEMEANMLLSMQCTASALASEVSMWIALRSDDPDRAWVCLIDMQEYLQIAERAHSATVVSEFIVRAVQHENTLFPPIMFVSPEFRYRPGKCTICAEQFDRCPHEEDAIYLGRLCREVERQKVSVEHVALVKKPRDKRCRLASIEDAQGCSRHWFTNEEVTAESNGSEAGRKFNALVFHAYSLKNV